MKKTLFLIAFMLYYDGSEVVGQVSNHQPVVPLANGSILLEPNRAYLSKNGETQLPKLIPFVDGDGFDCESFLPQLKPEDGVFGWTVSIPKSGRYLLTLEFAHTRQGNAFKVSA